MNGPFQTERAISLTLVAATDDHAVGALVGARLVTLGRLTPGRDRMPSARAAALAAAQRMIHRVHHHATIMRPLAKPAGPTGLADLLVHVVGVRHRADRGHALGAHDAQFARHQLDLRPAGVLADKLRKRPGRARDLAAGADFHFDVV